ncbi:MAG: hypothetical protein SNH94_06050 [Rikenellaceae bacterium]
MKKIFNLFVVALAALSVVSCSDSDDQDPASDQIVINYRNMRGVWELSSLNGEAIEGDAYFYITFLLSDEDEQEFELYYNLDSAFAQSETGVYTIEADEDDSSLTVISGYYYAQFLETWSSDYIVSSFTADTMEWTDYDSCEKRTYIRVDEVPSDIVAGTRTL